MDFGQVTRSTPVLAPLPLLTFTPRQWEDIEPRRILGASTPFSSVTPELESVTLRSRARDHEHRGHRKMIGEKKYDLSSK
ncbi:hypothetical protein TNCV_2948681 [Trichonephila clavipes]|nr:hypothetical protein TNCV_2948681 [Trichonephila clavipes]